MISTLLTTLLIIDALVLIILIIALQQGNEGGLGGAFGGGNTTGFFGASGGVKLIVRATWICGVLFFALAIASSWERTNSKYYLKNQLEKTLSTPTPTENPVAAPVVPETKTSEGQPEPSKQPNK